MGHTARRRVLTRLPAPTTTTPTRLAVISDPHLTRRHRGTWKVLHETEDRLTRALSVARGADVDAICLPGDLTKDGTRRQFEGAFRTLADPPAPLVAVPGNHDVPLPAEWPDDGPGASLYPAEPYPHVETVNGLTVIGLDTASAATDRAGGYLPPEQLDRLERALEATSQSVVLAHHPLGADWTDVEDALPTEPFLVENAAEVIDRLRGHATVVIAGHVHWPIVGRTEGVSEVVAPATCSYPQAMLLVTVAASGTTVELVALASEDERADARRHLHDDPVLDGAYAKLAARAQGRGTSPGSGPPNA